MKRRAAQHHFGNWLRREIENRLLTYAEFASKAGISTVGLGNIMKADQPALRGITIVKIAHALDLPREEVEAHLHGHATAA